MFGSWAEVDGAQVTRSLKDEVTTEFAQLLAKGDVAIEDLSRGHQPFGNEWITLQGQGFRLRLTRDRGSEDAEISFDGDSERYSWYPLDWVVAALQLPEGSEAYPGPPRSISPAWASSLAGTLSGLLDGGRMDRDARARVVAAIERFGRRRLSEVEGDR